MIFSFCVPLLPPSLSLQVQFRSGMQRLGVFCIPPEVILHQLRVHPRGNVRISARKKPAAAKPESLTVLWGLAGFWGLCHALKVSAVPLAHSKPEQSSVGRLKDITVQASSATPVRWMTFLWGDSVAKRTAYTLAWTWWRVSAENDPSSSIQAI